MRGSLVKYRFDFLQKGAVKVSFNLKFRHSRKMQIQPLTKYHNLNRGFQFKLNAQQESCKSVKNLKQGCDIIIATNYSVQYKNINRRVGKKINY